MKHNRVLEYIGRNSLYFYAFQKAFAIPFAVSLIILIFTKLGVESRPMFAFNLLAIFITLLVLTIISECINDFLEWKNTKKKEKSI